MINTQTTKDFFLEKKFEIDLDHPIWEKTLEKITNYYNDELKKFINKNTKSIIENSIEQSLSKPIKEIKEQIKKNITEAEDKRDKVTKTLHNIETYDHFLKTELPQIIEAETQI